MRSIFRYNCTAGRSVEPSADKSADGVAIIGLYRSKNGMWLEVDTVVLRVVFCTCSCRGSFQGSLKTAS